jgi:hypothetical protein
MRRTAMMFKSGQPSTSLWWAWVNDPIEPENISADWQPPAPKPTPPDDDPPF